ncbi:MAG: hypothetical protein COB62_00585 [Piscirickettsiaceae bacterium]|nr:MAG: hypothetical protein COB62_00585 [Piscirickettsiaceae bacterium]
MRFIILVGIILLSSGCSQEQQNRISRLGVNWLEGNYKVTFYEGNYKKEWLVLDGKVTSEAEKGYYYFWVKEGGKKKYVQTPIDRTIIEEF